jgi:hypothetical protein
MQEFRVGDVLRVGCLPVETQVSAIRPFYASVRWPWHEVDPESAFKWNGDRGFNRDPSHYEWDGELYRLSPEAGSPVPLSHVKAPVNWLESSCGKLS